MVEDFTFFFFAVPVGSCELDLGIGRKEIQVPRCQLYSCEESAGIVTMFSCPQRDLDCSHDHPGHSIEHMILVHRVCSVGFEEI